MLDFYYIKENDLNPEYPDESRYIGGLSLREFDSLKEICDFSERKGFEFTFFSDFRLSKCNLICLGNFIENILKCYKRLDFYKKEVYLKLKKIIDDAIKNNEEIFCFSD